MRVSTSTIFDLGVANLQQQTSRLMQVQQQIGANRRILTPADDPTGSARALEVSQSQAISQQYDANIGAAGDSLSLEESVLGSITELLQSARDVTNSAGNGGYNQSDRASLASQLRGQYQELIGLANSTDTNGQYLFAGYRSATNPFSQTAPGVVAYNGDQGQRLMQVGPTRQIEVSNSGEGLFRRIPAGNGNFVTQPASTNSGTALIDNGNTLDATKWNVAANSKDFTIKYAVSAAVPPVTTYDIIDNVTGNSWITGNAPGAAPYPRAYTSGSAVDFSRAASTTLDSGANVTISSAPASGDTFTITHAGATTITAAATGANTGSGLISVGTVTDAAKWGAAPNLTIKFDVSGGITTYDVVDSSSPGISLLTGNPSAGAGPYPRYYKSGSAIDLGLPALDLGAQATVSGAPKDGDSFALAPSTSQDVFKTIDALATLLETTTDKTALTNGLTGLQRNLDNALNNVISARSSVGSRMKELDGLKNGNDSLALQYSQSLSRLQDLDYAKAASEFTQQQVTLQAAQQAFVKVAGLSLFNYL